MDDLTSISHDISQLREYNRTHKLEQYKPYKFQREFHHAKGEGAFKFVPSDINNIGLAIQRALMCANQIGKTLCGGMETAMHLTGIYPEWWKGHRFKHAIEFICASTTNETTRDRCQRELLGEPSDDTMLGTGAIPLECIGKLTRKAGVPNAQETVLVKHVSGDWSKLYFKCYEQGAKKFMGYRVNGAWCDEEPPQDIWSQILRGLIATNGMAFITFTPEEGVTDVVHGFLNERSQGQSLTQATWDDAPHITDDTKEQKLASLPPHERDMRSKGIPVMGSGLIFPVNDEELIIDPVPLPQHYARICGVDFGYDHPFAAVWLAHDRDTDKVYLYDCFRQSKMLTPMAADRLKNGQCTWIPVAWPHDGLIHDKQTGIPLADIYRQQHNINMLPDKFSNPPGPGQKEGQGGQGVEVGLQAILDAMVEGRFKVFSTCGEWFEEKATYHRKEGKVVKIRDDLMSATRYAYQSLRHATTNIRTKQKQSTIQGLRNW